METSSSRPLRISGICERDMDLLILEEFLSSREFQQWFLASTLGAGSEALEIQEGSRSVTDSTGESDLEVDFINVQGEVIRILIENKVDAGLQPRQAARYGESSKLP